MSRDVARPASFSVIGTLAIVIVVNRLRFERRVAAETRALVAMPCLPEPVSTVAELDGLPPPTPCAIRGMRVPFEADVTWQLESGPLT